MSEIRPLDIHLPLVFADMDEVARARKFPSALSIAMHPDYGAKTDILSAVAWLVRQYEYRRSRDIAILEAAEICSF